VKVDPDTHSRRSFVRDDIWRILDEVKDPEVPVLSVVELGVVRDVVVEEQGVTVVITPTYSGCPAMKVIEDDIVTALRQHGISNVSVRTTYTPAWTTDWMSDEAKKKLEAYGIAPPGAATRDVDLIPLRRRGAPIRCPYCGSTHTRIESEFGSTACKAICYCADCRQPFELFKPM
jgi:ring-1,2-phenylacetyl-CoA epoxidase subunit PaaD